MTNNILLCYLSSGGTSYYYDFADELIRNGNSVLHWNLYESALSEKNKDEIIKKIKNFNPNLVFSYNNICPEDVIKVVNAVLVILDADNPEFFSNKKIINKYDFYYLGYQSNSKELYERILNVKITDKNYLLFPTATNFKKEPSIPQSINISFIGSNFYRNFLEGRILNLKEINDMLFLSRKISQNYYFKDNNFDEELTNLTKFYLAGQQRLKYLSVLSDLGLQIYSNSNWKDLLFYDFELVNCYNEKIIITQKENQDIYNASRLSINLSHLQATKSFSWRVPDIMASNSCLVIEDKIDWHMIFGNYISAAVKKSIIYQDQYDLRSKCIKLLNDEDLRLRCVEECQYAIEKNGRWKDRIKDLEPFLNLKLLGIENPSACGSKISIENKPKLSFVKSEDIVRDYKQSDNSVKALALAINLECNHLSNINPNKTKSSFSVWLKSFLVWIYFLPLLGKRIIKKRKVAKMLKIMSAKINQDA